MDRRVKERLVGATILVALLVLIVPELLSGPKSPVAPAPMLPASEAASEPMRTVTVDLTTSPAAPAADSNVASAASASPPPDGVAASATPDSPPAQTASAAPPTITTLKAQQPANAAPVETVTAPPKSSMPAKSVSAHEPVHSGWAVQLGSFASRVNADNLVRQLKGHDAPAYVLSSGKGTELRYKVRIGPLADRAAADRLRLKLTKDGHAASLVAP